MIVSSSDFERRVARLSATIYSRVFNAPPPSSQQIAVAKYPSNCRVVYLFDFELRRTN